MADVSTCVEEAALPIFCCAILLTARDDNKFSMQNDFRFSLRNDEKEQLYSTMKTSN
jgi:hypothetical protein